MKAKALEQRMSSTSPKKSRGSDEKSRGSDEKRERRQAAVEPAPAQKTSPSRHKKQVVEEVEESKESSSATSEVTEQTSPEDDA